MTEQQPTKRQRLTKKEVGDYVVWCFSDEVKDKIPNWSLAEIKKEYFNATGKRVSRQFISDQKKKWVLIDGKICKV